MQLFRIALIPVVVLFGTTSNGEDPVAFKAVQDLFAAMSDFDYSDMRAQVTKDFQVLENGDVWAIDDLIAAIKPSGRKYERRNFFSVIKTVADDDVVWVSYWNRAAFESSGRRSEAAWLESAVMVKIDEVWKLQLLHSTVIDTNRVPSEVEFREYP